MTGPVLLVNNSRWFGGAEMYLEHLMHSYGSGTFAELATRASAPSHLVNAAVAAGVPLTMWRPTPIGLMILLRAMRRARVVHVNMAWSGDNAHAVAVAWLCRRPVLATVHIWVRPRSALRRRVLALGYRRFERVIAVSNEIERLLVSELGVSPEVIRIVPNGVPSRAPVRRTARPTVVVGGLGRLAPAKGFDLLIEAVRRLYERGHAVEAVIGGDGPERPVLEQAAQGLPVRFLGFVEDTGAFLDGVDIFCLPSRWEGLPFALLEAMMAGAACVAADVGDVAVGLGTAGRLVPPENADALTSALEELLTTPRLRTDLGQAARRHAMEHFGLDPFVARTLAVYREVENVSRRRSRRLRSAVG